MDKTPHIEDLISNLKYDPVTGDIHWVGRMNNKLAGSHNWAGYRRVRINGCECMSHRIAWAMHYGEWPKGDIDHINGIKDDNRIENLRDVSRSLNTRNRHKHPNNTSGVCGVSYAKDRDRWLAKISYGGRQVLLGSFKDKDEAVKVRLDAEAKYGYTDRHGT